MSRSSRLAVLLAASATLITAAPAAAPAATDDPTATAARKCSTGYSGYGTDYVYSPITARNVTCRRAKRLVRAFHGCRPGKTGRCPRVDGYSCSENRFNKSRFSYDSIATCTRGGKLVRHKYTQRT